MIEVYPSPNLFTTTRAKRGPASQPTEADSTLPGGREGRAVQ